MTDGTAGKGSSAHGRYHHGDLAAALVAAGLELVRAGGPAALGLREATRVAGVSPSAAYRHFADRAALVSAVADQALHQAGRAMQARMDDDGADTDPARRARGHLRAVGLGYIDFALAEPGLFQLAFQTPGPSDATPDVATHYASPTDQVQHPLVLLMSALDELVEVGVLTAARRANAEWACWSAVHGLSDLATRGPLHAQARAAVQQLAEYVVDAAIDGVVGGDPSEPSTTKPVTGAGAKRSRG
ncbi:TetR-like C-terminal domain-containing protein [Allobranchiibius sp. GilTou38]|uniref:TetR/AcrR family transcriptional regulator n=1 Tax=Allobranchiibius sp. GilTou38 TaxID=2815210 RepID=UPI001AA0D2AD|nr:TetR-like C-terminal domain-containing protein [Allobranchiibius sp. GilTou38]MBO1766931.1 WHG domain-containing protein [Allobranchiibius sp. GilTou38]